MTVNHETLLALADEAATRAYAPYSKFHVGAALLTRDGTVFQGCNVENSSYGLANCAERTAVFSAVTAGHQEFTAIAIVQGGDRTGAEPCWPCGACRQVLIEFNPDMDVIFRKPGGVQVTTLRELMPHFFDKNRLFLEPSK
jgi:cytidine deaminase